MGHDGSHEAEWWTMTMMNTVIVNDASHLGSYSFAAFDWINQLPDANGCNRETPWFLVGHTQARNMSQWWSVRRLGWGRGRERVHTACHVWAGRLEALILIIGYLSHVHWAVHLTCRLKIFIFENKHRKQAYYFLGFTLCHSQGIISYLCIYGCSLMQLTPNIVTPAPKKTWHRDFGINVQ